MAQPTEILAAPTSVVAVPTERCPSCGVSRPVGARFCEECGTDFNAAEPVGLVVWEAIVSADRVQFERFAPAGVEFPARPATVSVPLDAPELLLGREAAEGVLGTIDDPAVS